MFKLLVAVGSFPFFLIGALDFTAHVLSYVESWPSIPPPQYTHWVLALLWIVFVHSAQEPIQQAADEVAAALAALRAWLADWRDRILRRGVYHREMWWLLRFPGVTMTSRGSPALFPMIEDDYKRWKAEMKAQGYGPRKKDPGLSGKEPFN